MCVFRCHGAVAYFDQTLRGLKSDVSPALKDISRNFCRLKNFMNNIDSFSYLRFASKCLQICNGSLTWYQKA